MNYPSVSLLVYFCNTIKEDNNPQIANNIFFSALTVVISTMVHILVNKTSNSYPNYPSMLYYEWTSPISLLFVIHSLILFAANASIDYISYGNKWGHILIFSYSIITNSLLLFYSYFYLNGVSQVFNQFRVSIFGLALEANIIMLLSYIINTPPGFSLGLFAIIILPTITISSHSVAMRLEKFKTIINRMINENDFSEMKSYSSIKLLSMIGHSYSIVAGHWEIFEQILQIYPKKFDCLAFYTKFAHLAKVGDKKLNSLLERLHEFPQLRSKDRITLAFFDNMFHFPILNENSRVIEEIATCVVNDYTQTLKLFWTEVLLGQYDRLISLSMTISQKYQEVIDLFESVGDNTIIDKQKERFYSFISIKIDDEKKKDNSINVYEQSINTMEFTMVDEKIADPLSHCFRSAAVQGYEKRYSSLVSRAQHFAFYLPIYFGLIELLCYLIFNLLTNNKLDNAISLFNSLAYSLFSFGSSFFAYSYIPIADANNTIVNTTKMAVFLSGNDFFKTELLNPRLDISYLISNFAGRMVNLTSAFNLFSKPEIVGDIFTQDLLLNFSYESGIQIDSIFLIPYLYFYSSQLIVHVSLSKEDTLKVFNSSNTKRFNSNAMEVLDFLSDYYFEKSQAVVKQVINDVKKTYNIFEVITMVLTLFIFILIFISIYFLNKNYKVLLSPLFALPKVTISNFIEKIGKKVSSSGFLNIPDEELIKYNLSLLSNRRPAQYFLTSAQIMIRTFLVSFFLTIAFSLVITPFNFSTINAEINSMQFLNISKYSVYMPTLMFEMGHVLFGILTRMNLGLSTDSQIQDYYNLCIKVKNTVPLMAEDAFQLFRKSRSNLFFGEATDPKNINITLLQYPLIDRIDVLLTNSFYFIQTIENIKTEDGNNYDEDLKNLVEELISSLFASISLQMPKYIDQILLLSYTENKLLIDIAILGIIINLVLIAIVNVILNVVSYRIKSDNNFIRTVFQTIPFSAIPSFKQFIETKEIDIRNKDSSMTNELIQAQIFDQESTLLMLKESIIFVDNENKIVGISPSGQSLLQLDNFENDNKIGTNLIKFINELSSCRVDFILPPENPDEFEFYALLPNFTQIILRANLIPLKHFFFQGTKIPYVCILNDITKLSHVIHNKFLETNRLKLVLSQLVPPELIDFALDNSSFQQVMLPKAVIIFVYISGVEKFNNEYDISTIHEAITSSINTYPDMMFIGRSSQFFRVVSGITNASLSTPRIAADAINFSLNLLSNLKQAKIILLKDFNIHIALHMVESQIADFLSEMPPSFDIFGEDSSVPMKAAISCSPNQVNITRDVYEAVFDQGYNISFEDEIEKLNGEFISIHQVHNQ